MDAIAQKSLEKLPPFHQEAEQAILGAILLDDTAMYRALTCLTHDDPAGDFYRRSHAQVWAALWTLIDTRQQAADLLLLKEELERLGVLDACGGPAYLAHLMDQAPSAANIEYHANLVHEKAIARRLLNASIETATRCYDDHEDPTAIYADATAKLNAIGNGIAQAQEMVVLDTLLPEVLNRLDAKAQAGTTVVGLPCGLRDVDDLTGGFLPGDLILIAARPSMGKTALATLLTYTCAAVKQQAAIFFSLEMERHQLVEARFVAQLAKVNMKTTPHWTAEDWTRVDQARERLTGLPIYVDDTPAQLPAMLEAKVRRIQSQRPVGVVVVDYVGLLGVDRRKRQFENANAEVTQHSKDLKAMAKKLHVPVVALSQLSRACEKRQGNEKRPILSDLRDSGSLEQDSDVVIFIYRHEWYHPGEQPGVAEIIIGKQRNGATGSVAVAFQKEYTSFQDLAPASTAAYWQGDSDEPAF